MKVKNLNRSSEKTKKIIKNTFAELIKENKELYKITVTELVKRADINRGTFYNHYDSIYAVAEELEAEIIKILFKNQKRLNTLNDIFKYLDEIIAYLKENQDIYRLLLSSNEPQLFLKKLNHLILEKLYDSLNNNPNFKKSNTLKFEIAFFTDGIVNQVLNYFTAKSDYSLEEICTNTKNIFKILFCNEQI
jgi:AcrR family transcriptional regulator